MSEISLILVLLKKTNKTLNDMAKVQIKSEKLTPFGGIFSIIDNIGDLVPPIHAVGFFVAEVWYRSNYRSLT